MSENKSELLRSLERAREQPAREPRWRSARLLLAAAAFLAALTGVWLVLFQTPGPSAAQAPGVLRDPPSSATTDNAAPKSLEPASGLVASGYVVARRKATIAAEITGKIIAVPVEEGMAVGEGQELARLDSTLAEIDLASARAKMAAVRAGLDSAKADLADAERIFERTRSLQSRKDASEADLTRNEARVAVLKAQKAKAQADLETAEIEVRRGLEAVDKHHIRAPFSGVVVDRSAQMGEIISPLSAGGGFTRTGVCTIVDMDSLEIEVEVNEALIHRVTPDQPVQAVLDAYPDWHIAASVIAVVPTANRDKATIKVRVALLQKDPRILPDMAAKVTFLGPKSKGEPG